MSDVDYDLIVKSSRGSVSRALNYIDEDSSSISHKQNFIDCLRFAFLAKKSKKAVLEGFVKQDTISVKMLRHYAEDAGKSKYEIDQITKPEFKLSFIANGVIIN